MRRPRRTLRGASPAVFGALFVIASIGWFIFVVWWMVSLKTEIQRIRETIEHRVYDFDDDDEEGRTLARNATSWTNSLDSARFAKVECSPTKSSRR